MKPCLNDCFFVGILLLCIFQTSSISVAGPLNSYGVESDNPYVVRRFEQDRKTIDEVIVPGRLPETCRTPLPTISEPISATGTNTLSSVPAFDWSYGCSATSAAMMFGYYDNIGYSNLYAGPTNGGVCPMTNAAWGEGECPLSATHQGFDGRTINGHVDDYWIAYGSTAQDPYIGDWTEHLQGECTGDFMGSNQSAKSNIDGATTFYFYTDGSPTYDYAGTEPGKRDGCHGMKLFFESRGYTVNSNYSQYIMGYKANKKGFTFENYIQEIDAGRPVMIHLMGHTMLGYGYNDSGSLIYLHDTWDYNSHQMVWGGSYSEMQHVGVTVFIPSSTITNPILSVIPTTQAVGSGSGTTAFSVSNTGSGTLSWKAAVTSGSSWLSISSGISGSNAGMITCSFSDNTTTSSRTGIVSIADSATASVDVTVTQAAPIMSTECTAMIDVNLLLHIPYLSYVDEAFNTKMFWADFVYEYISTYPTVMFFKLTHADIIEGSSFSCEASTLDSDLSIHIPDVQLPDGITHLWVDLVYKGNDYFVVTNYRVLSN